MAAGLLYLRCKMAIPLPIQISIPQPCHEDWHKMTPTEQGRFCNSCQKCVIDFTSFTDRQLHSYFTEHNREHICGRYYAFQLNREIFPAAQQSILFRKYFVALGLTIVFAEILPKHLFAKTPFSYEAPAFFTDNEGKNDSTTLKGTVVDNGKEPLIGVFVEVKQNGFTKAGAVTDEEGAYSIALKPGKYQLIIRYMGFFPDTTDLIVSNKPIILKTQLRQDTTFKERMIVMGGGVRLIEEEPEKTPILTQTKLSFWRRITNWLR